jgi:hypothetical protein
MVAFCNSADMPKNIPSYLVLDSFDDMTEVQMKEFQFLIVTQITKEHDTGHRSLGGDRIVLQKPAFGVVLAKDEQGVSDWVIDRGTNKFSPITYRITRLNMVKATLTATVE